MALTFKHDISEDHALLLVNLFFGMMMVYFVFTKKRHDWRPNNDDGRGVNAFVPVRPIHEMQVSTSRLHKHVFERAL